MDGFCLRDEKCRVLAVLPPFPSFQLNEAEIRADVAKKQQRLEAGHAFDRYNRCRWPVGMAFHRHLIKIEWACSAGQTTFPGSCLSQPKLGAW